MTSLYTSNRSYYNGDSGVSYIAVAQNGSVYAFGGNDGDRLGMREKPSDFIVTNYKQPQKSRISNVKEASCAEKSCLWLKKDGTVTETTTDFYEKAITIPNNEKIVDVEFSPPAKFALSETGKLFVWGDGSTYLKDYYMLGMGNVQRIDSPTEMTMLGSVARISVDLNTVTVLTQKGELYGWGMFVPIIGGTPMNPKPTIYSPSLIPTPNGEKVVEVFGAGEMIRLQSGLFYGTGHFVKTCYLETQDSSLKEDSWMLLNSLSSPNKFVGGVESGIYKDPSNNLHLVGWKSELPSNTPDSEYRKAITLPKINTSW